MKNLKEYIKESILGDWNTVDADEISERMEVEEWIKNTKNIRYDGTYTIENNIVKFTSSNSSQNSISILSQPLEGMKIEYDDNYIVAVDGWARTSKDIATFNKNLCICHVDSLNNIDLYYTRGEYVLNLDENFTGFNKSHITLDKSCPKLEIDMRYTRVTSSNDLDVSIKKNAKQQVMLHIAFTTLASDIWAGYNSEFRMFTTGIQKQLQNIYKKTKCDVITLGRIGGSDKFLSWNKYTKEYDLEFGYPFGAHYIL